MKTLINLRRSVIVATIAGLAMAAYSQDIVVTVGSDDSPGQTIPWNAAPNQKYRTSFGSVNVAGGSGSWDFGIYNIDVDTPLNLGLIQVISGDTGDFTIVPPSSNTVNPNGSVSFDIVFDPTQTGVRSAVVSIPNDDPDVGGNPFLLNVTGVGIAGFPLAEPDLDLQYDKIKAKRNKKTFMTDISGTLLLENYNNVPSGPVTINLYASNEIYRFLYDSDPLVGSVTTPANKSIVSGDKPIKVKFKVSTGLFYGTLYARIAGANGLDTDTYFAVMH